MANASRIATYEVKLRVDGSVDGYHGPYLREALEKYKHEDSSTFWACATAREGTGVESVRFIKSEPIDKPKSHVVEIRVPEGCEVIVVKK